MGLPINPNEKVEELIEIVQSILKIGPTEVVGIDIGQSAIRVAEIINPKKNEYKLVRFAYKQLPEGCLIEDEILRPEDVVAAITECISMVGIKNKNVCIGLSGANTMSKKLQVVDGPEQEIADQVTWESEQYIPFGADEAIISYSVLGKNDGGGVDVMVAAAKKEVVEVYKGLIKNCNLKLKIVDLDLFALSNIYEVVYGAKHREDREGILLIDFGAQKTNIVIYHTNMVVFTREMNIGGMVITEEVQRQLGLSYAEAENLKTVGDQNGNIPEEIVEIIKINLENFLNEIRKTLTFFMTAATDISIGYCYITGGAALTPGLAEGLAKMINVEVCYINPFEVIQVEENAFSEEELNYIASSGCVTLGLALRKMKR